MKIYVVIVGLNRSLSFTGPSINQELVAPLTRGWPVKPGFHLTLIEPESGEISNPRSGEHGRIETSLPPPFSQWPSMTVSEEDVLTRLSELGIDHEVVRGEWDDSGKSWKNYLTHMVALEKTIVQQREILNADFIVLARPDLRIDEHLHLRLWIALMALLSLFQPNLALLPSWGKYRGLNDRFAILSRQAATTYFTRIQQAKEFFSSHPTSNSEQFLLETMKETTVLSVISTNMVRVRIGGIVHPPDITNGRQRRLSARMPGIIQKSLRRLKKALTR